MTRPCLRRAVTFPIRGNGGETDDYSEKIVLRLWINRCDFDPSVYYQHRSRCPRTLRERGSSGGSGDRAESRSSSVQIDAKSPLSAGLPSYRGRSPAGQVDSRAE